MIDDQDQSSDDERQMSKALSTIDVNAPSGWRLKLAKATAQLLVGTRAGAAVYADAREHLDEIEGRSAMNRQLYAIASQQILNDPEMIERAKARLIGGILQKQENLEAVVQQAEKRMQALPRPQSSSNIGELPNIEEMQKIGSVDEPLESDWAATFADLAENANSDALRERLAKVLSGEVASKGAFPRATIRAIAELEQADLETLVSVLSFTIGTGIAADPSIPKMALEALRDCGIVDFNPSFGVTLTWSGKPDSPGAFAGRDWAAIMEVREEKSVAVPWVPFTRLGKAVVNLLDDFHEGSALRNIIKSIDLSGINRITLGKYINNNDGTIKIANGEIVFPRPIYVDMGQKENK